ncbi:hypothetical protein [Streptomyces antibioticus]|uniref:hypothetical protein n=1 Tax=Streptomyces antibioticus TaxID=1890 RepID=UPI0033FB1F32
MTEVHLHIEQRTLEPGRPVAVWPGRRALYAAYDPEQLSEEQAIQAIALLAPGLPVIAGVTRTGKESAGISAEGIAKHG